MHFAATLDNLINLASRDCLLRKEAAKRARQGEATLESETPTESALEVRVLDVVADEGAESGLTSVMLSRGDTVVSGVHAHQGGPLIESVVAATARALERLIPGKRFAPDLVRLIEQAGVRSVSVAGRVLEESREAAASAVRVVQKNPYLAAAEATVDAVMSQGKFTAM
jgi:hypothetical protein